MTGYEVTADQLKRFGGHLNGQVMYDFRYVVEPQARGQGCNRDGFTGLLSPLQGTMEQLSSITWDLIMVAIERLQGTANGLFATADAYLGVEHEAEREIDASAPDNKRPDYERG